MAAPRPHRGQPLPCTWPELLKQKFSEIDIWQRCRPASMTPDVIKEYRLFSDSIECFDYLIVQVGIGDCCPRPFPLWLQRLFELTLSKPALNKINNFYPSLLKFYSRPWISIEHYVEAYNEIVTTSLERNNSIKICIIAIGPPCHDFLIKAPGVSDSQKFYNQQLSASIQALNNSRVEFIDPYLGENPEVLFIKDGHHLTAGGHEVVAKAISSYWERDLCQDLPIRATTEELHSGR